MLKLAGDDFTRGRAKFFDHSPDRTETTAKVFVKIALADFSFPVLAQLDTGAAWSVLDPGVARRIGALNVPGTPAKLSTRFGMREGRLVPILVTLLADEGDSLQIEGTFFVTADWPQDGCFLGYSGLLDLIRFALDPPRNDFYFGESSGRP
jgi:hypothetical protein